MPAPISSEVHVLTSKNHDGIDFEACGEGPSILLVPGSCSTGAAWRPVISHLRDRYRCITTSLPGYGGTRERRTRDDASIERLAEVVEAVAERADGPALLVGHSFGGLVGLAVALRQRVDLRGLIMIEPPAVGILDAQADERHALAFRHLATRYRARYAHGDTSAIADMIDFYGGLGTFASWPERIRAYAIETTPANLLDWQSAYGFALQPAVLSALTTPTLILCGEDSHPAMQCVTERLQASIGGAKRETIDGAAHFMIATHPGEVARIIDQYVQTTLTALDK